MRCHTQMTEGFVADYSDGSYVRQFWSPGIPEKSFWKGLKIDESQRIPVITRRCPNCGCLESYAMKETELNVAPTNPPSL
jgi:hypothetical protein